MGGAQITIGNASPCLLGHWCASLCPVLGCCSRSVAEQAMRRAQRACRRCAPAACQAAHHHQPKVDELGRRPLVRIVGQQDVLRLEVPVQHGLCAHVEQAWSIHTRSSSSSSSTCTQAHLLRIRCPGNARTNTPIQSQHGMDAGMVRRKSTPKGLWAPFHTLTGKRPIRDASAPSTQSNCMLGGRRGGTLHVVPYREDRLRMQRRRPAPHATLEQWELCGCRVQCHRRRAGRGSRLTCAPELCM